MNFYDRKPVLVNGAYAYKNDEDERNEQEVAEILSAYFSKPDAECRFRPFARFDFVDWWVERKERMVGLAELKCRSHASTTYPTVFLAVRKWLALRMAEAGLGVKAIFAVRFTDGVYYIPIFEVDATQHAWRGCSKDRAVNSRNTKEPVIEVPVKDMHRVEVNKGGDHEDQG